MNYQSARVVIATSAVLMALASAAVAQGTSTGSIGANDVRATFLSIGTILG